MKIEILFDSIALNKSFATGWGVSFLIDRRILFDTGEKPDPLIENMKIMGIDIAHIEAVVVSHDHWDHRGGLCALLKETAQRRVYVCPNFSQELKERVTSSGNRLIEVEKWTQISRDVSTTGEISGMYKSKYMPEQALVLKTARGMTILTGCAHPGIIEMIEYIEEHISDRIYLVMGGFHLMNKDEKTIKSIVHAFRQHNIERVAPTHCTGKEALALFKKAYENNFLEVRVGNTIEV